MTRMDCRQGFTILEVMVAISLLTVAILGAATMQISALGGSNIAIRTTNASTLASAAIEDLISMDYDDSSLNNTVASVPTTAAAYETAMNDLTTAFAGPVTNDGFEVFWNVAEDYPIADTKAIRVIVRRSDKGVFRTVSLDYIKMRPSS